LAIFNSHSLTDYFKLNKLGVFSGRFTENYWTFDHITNSIRPQSLEEYNLKRKRKLIFYARPESHANRNLFSVGVMAIKGALNKGHFLDWEIVGMGSLSGPLKYQITNNQEMTIYPKTNSETYQNFVRTGDVGLSLIMAPHPGLVHYEMVNAGLIVVVNTFETRSANYYNNYSPLFVPVENNLENIIEGSISAEKMSYDTILRFKTQKFNHEKTSWDEVFPKEKIKKIFTEIIGQ
jgi:hypothetical protein